MALANPRAAYEDTLTVKILWSLKIQHWHARVIVPFEDQRGPQ